MQDKMMVTTKILSPIKLEPFREIWQNLEDVEDVEDLEDFEVFIRDFHSGGC